MMLFTISFGLLNLITAVIIEIATDSRDRDVAHQLKLKNVNLQLSKNNFERLCGEMDVDKDGHVNLVEMIQSFDNGEEFHKCVRMMDVERADLQCMFHVMDIEDSGRLMYTEFADQMYKWQTKDMRHLLMFVKQDVADARKALQKQIDSLRHDLMEKLDGIQQGCTGESNARHPEKTLSPPAPSACLQSLAKAQRAALASLDSLFEAHSASTWEHSLGKSSHPQGNVLSTEEDGPRGQQRFAQQDYPWECIDFATSTTTKLIVHNNMLLSAFHLSVPSAPQNGRLLSTDHTPNGIEITDGLPVWPKSELAMRALNGDSIHEQATWV